MAIHTEQSWKRHSNPWSVWTRILSYPLAYVPVWNRFWKQGAVVGAWFTANPVIFPPTPGRVLVGYALRPWGAAVDRQAAAGLSHGTQIRVGCVLHRCAARGLQAALLAFDELD
jgi:hypothetical protein